MGIGLYGNKIQGLCSVTFMFYTFYSSNFELNVTAMTLKLQEVANFLMFFHVMQTTHFTHACVRLKYGNAFMNRVYVVIFFFIYIFMDQVELSIQVNW